MHSWHVVQEVIVNSKNGIVRVKDEIVTAAFQEACTSGLNMILQPVIHLQEERNHCHYHRTGRSPPMIPSDSSSLPSPIQRSR